LKNVEELRNFVQAVFGLIVPYYEGLHKSRSASEVDGELSLSQLVHTRPDTIAILQSALATTLSHDRVQEVRRRHSEKVIRAKQRAYRDILVAQTDKTSRPPASFIELPLTDSTAMENALAILHMLDASNDMLAFPRATDRALVQQEGHVAFMIRLPNNLIPTVCLSSHPRGVM
jgi:hypothetical protein